MNIEGELLYKTAQREFRFVENAIKSKIDNDDDTFLIYHLHQVCEKYMKSLIAFSGEPYEKSHTIKVLHKKLKSLNLEITDLNASVENKFAGLNERTRCPIDELTPMESFSGLLDEYLDATIKVKNFCEKHYQEMKGLMDYAENIQSENTARSEFSDH